MEGSQAGASLVAAAPLEKDVHAADLDTQSDCTTELPQAATEWLCSPSKEVDSASFYKRNIEVRANLKIEHALPSSTMTLAISVSTSKSGGPGAYGPVTRCNVIRPGVVVSADRHIHRKYQGLSDMIIRKNPWLNLSHLTFVKSGDDTHATIPFLNNEVCVALAMRPLKYLHTISVRNLGKTKFDDQEAIMKLLVDVVETIRRVSWVWSLCTKPNAYPTNH